MIDVATQFESLKAAWMKRLYNTSKIFNVIPRHLFKKLGGIELCSNMSFMTSKHFPGVTSLPSFWSEVLQAHAKAYDSVIEYCIP